MKKAKKLKLIILCTLTLGLVFLSCNENESNVPKEEVNFIDFNVDFNFMNEEFSFEGDRKDMINNFMAKMDKTLLNDNLFDESEGQGYIRWEVSLLDNKIHIKQTVKNVGEEINQRSISAAGSSCPTGLVEYAKCSGLGAESCTKTKAEELASNLKTGETFSVTRTGFASTLICGTKSLVDRTLKNEK